MTGKVTTGEWQPASFDAIDLTQIPDWTSLVDGKETKQLPAVDLKYDDWEIIERCSAFYRTKFGRTGWRTASFTNPRTTTF